MTGTILILTGLALVCLGVLLVSVPAGLIVGGVELATIGVVYALAAGLEDNDDSRKQN